MVRHMGKSPLVEVLGSSLVMCLCEKSWEKYCVVRYITGMRIDMG